METTPSAAVTSTAESRPVISAPRQIQQQLPPVQNQQQLQQQQSPGTGAVLTTAPPELSRISEDSRQEKQSPQVYYLYFCW